MGVSLVGWPAGIPYITFTDVSSSMIQTNYSPVRVVVFLERSYLSFHCANSLSSLASLSSPAGLAADSSTKVGRDQKRGLGAAKPLASGVLLPSLKK